MTSAGDGSVPYGSVPYNEAVTPWKPWTPDEVAGRIAGLPPVRWAVAGGWAVDLFLGRVTRPHEDLEIAVLETDAPVVLGAFSEPDWRWDVPLDGRVYPRASAAFDRTRQTWLWSQPVRGYVLDVFREMHDGENWICRRDPTIRRAWAEVVRASPTGTPYLAPEIVLLFKAKHARPKDVADLQAALPRLDPGGRQWLRTALQQVHPGHAWLDEV